MSATKSPTRNATGKSAVAIRKTAAAALATKPLARKSIAGTSKTATGQWIAFSKAVAGEEPARRIHRIRTGAKANFMVGAANALGVSRETIFGLVGLPTSTANRKIANDETLEIPVTERLARLAIIEEDAKETFGDPEVARAWLLADNAGLGGCSPLSMLDTDVGTREVSKTLVAIAYGGVV